MENVPEQSATPLNEASMLPRTTYDECYASSLHVRLGVSSFQGCFPIYDEFFHRPMEAYPHLVDTGDEGGHLLVFHLEVAGLLGLEVLHLLVVHLEVAGLHGFGVLHLLVDGKGNPCAVHSLHRAPEG